MEILFVKRVTQCCYANLTTMIKRTLSILFPFLFISLAHGQDPHYTQFFSAPFTVNPAYVGVFDGQYRAMCNYRQQWDNIAAPYITSTIGMDLKLVQEGGSKNPFNVGLQLMNDRSMNGVFKSNYFGLMASYHVTLDNEGYQTLGAGLSSSFGDRRIDYSTVTFDQQFTSGGFDVNLPSGESALQNMKPFISIGAGLLYRYDNDEKGEYFEFGASGFHFNKPKQTFLADPNEFLPVRISLQGSYQKYVNDYTILNIKALYQTQAKAQYLLGGLSVGKIIGDQKNLVGLGVWYRTSDAVSPYVFGEYSRIRLGLTYDVAVTDLKNVRKPSRSFEFSLQWRLRRANSADRVYMMGSN